MRDTDRHPGRVCCLPDGRAAGESRAQLAELLRRKARAAADAPCCTCSGEASTYALADAVAAERAAQKSTTIKASREYVRDRLRTIDLLETVIPVAIARAFRENIVMPQRMPVGAASLQSMAHYKLALQWAERIREGELPQDALPTELPYVLEQADPRWNRLGWFMQAFPDDIPEDTGMKLVGPLYDACRALIQDHMSRTKPSADKL